MIRGAFCRSLPALFASALLAHAGAAGAQETESNVPMSTEPVELMDHWTLQFEPAVHYIAPAGDIRLPNSAGVETDDTELDDLNLESPRLAPYGEVHLRRDKWRISISGFVMGQDDRGAVATEAFQLGDLSIAAGDRLESSLDFWTLEAVASYRVFADRTAPNSKGVIGAAVGIDVLGGMRFFDVDLDVSAPSGSQSENHLWAQPVVGARAEFSIWERFGFDVTSSVGYLPLGDNASYSLDIVAAFHWRPWDHVGVQVGYQRLAYTLEDGDNAEEFRWQGGMAGLFGGVLIRF